MSMLILGIVIWGLIHFIPAVAVDFRSGMIKRFGIPVYKGVFALLVIAALFFVIQGWKVASAQPVFVAPEWGSHVTIVLSFFAFILFFAPYINNSISRFLRHPQLLGVSLGSLGHLFSNGEARSIVLFAGFSVWALAEIYLLNRRDGTWARPAADMPTANIRLLLTAIGFFAMFMYTHIWLFGVSAVP